MDEPDNAQSPREEVHAMDVGEPGNAISTVSQATEQQQDQLTTGEMEVEGQEETSQVAEAPAPAADPPAVFEGNVETEEQAVIESEKQSEDPVADQDAASLESAIGQSNAISEPESNASNMAEQHPAEPATGDQDSRGLDDPTAAAAQDDSPNQSLPPNLETQLQENDQDASPSDGTGSGDATPQIPSSMNNLQVLAALNNVLAYRDSRDTFDEDPEDDVLILQEDDAEQAEASRPLGSATSNFTEDSALTSLGPQDGVMATGFDQLFDFPSGSGARVGGDLGEQGLDDEELADYSVPHSRFAGVYLDRVDRRKLRYYVPSPEVKYPQSLKITIKRPAGWTPRPAPPIETTRMDDVYMSSGRKTRRPQKSYYEDMVIVDQRRAALSEKRKGKQRDVEFDISPPAEEPTSRGRKASESVDYTIPAEDGNAQDQDVSDAYSNAESVSAVRKRQKRETQEHSRRSRRIPEKVKRAHWDGMDEDEMDPTTLPSPTNHPKPRQRRAAILQDEGDMDELARSYSEDSMIDLSEEPKSRKRTSGRKGGKGKGKRVIESDDDYELIEQDDESEPSVRVIDEDVLTYHRELCDKCFRPSAKELGKARKKRGRGKRRKVQEFEEESGDEAERLMGWIECEKCTVAYHWACLSGNIRQKHLSADKELPADQRIFYKGAPRGDDTLLLLCPHCESILLANCMVCGSSDPLLKPADPKTTEKADNETADVTTVLDKAITSEVGNMQSGEEGSGTANPQITGELLTDRTSPIIKNSVEDEEDVSKIDNVSVATRADDLDPDIIHLVDANDPLPPGKNAQAEKKESGMTTSADKDNGADSTPMDVDELENMESDNGEDSPLLFRCISCKRCAHYEHLPKPPKGRSDMTVEEVAAWYQEGELSEVYKCLECRVLNAVPEYILGWRPLDNESAEKKQDFGDDPLEDCKKPQRRKYLVKWKNRAFRHATWVSHDFLSSVSRGLLLNFLRIGVRVTLETESRIATKDSTMGEDVAEAVLGVDEESKGGIQSWLPGPPKADPEAREKIPTAWTTPDRILDVYFLKSAIHALKKQIVEGTMKTDFLPLLDTEHQKQLVDGIRPRDEQLITLDSAERILRRKFNEEDARSLIRCLGWVYVKWQDLQYEAATWDTPLLPRSPGYSAFFAAFEAYLWGRTVLVPTLKPLEAQMRDSRVINGFVRMANQPSCVKGGQLMDFQLEGLNWLMSKWHNLQSCILADDMGLGKTVQIASFLALLGSPQYHVFPHLIVVPNSTLQNWARELAKWAPHLRVVPYYGYKASKDIIRQFELYHEPRDVNTLKTHVVLTTYECITGKDFSVFARIPRWETLIVDEAQRLKAGTSLIFKKLNELNAVHRVLLTGTPMNNNIREILNLMNFLDPTEFTDLDALEKRYSVPDEELYKELRAKIAPFMLRRSKDQVLDLPPKNEIIVPLTMRPLQKQVYRGILERNAELMEVLARINKGKLKQKPKRSALHNVLMEMRKCLQHPFLCNSALDDYSLGPTERHQALIDGSAKLGFLKAMLPKLRAKGHRVLLFSQFKIALDIIEQFFDGEDFKYLRLDGDTPQAKRQKDIDAFNAPDSPYFIFLLSTRAGGVGVNLASADTVIIHDLDFNPHLDMQAIARSYRYGQKKTVMVYRLMMAQTVEANIMQASKKKLLLDHLIVQSLRQDKEEEDDFATIVLNGAKAVFEDKDENDIVYSGEGLDKMISDLETREKPENDGKGAGFTFAPVYDTVQNSAGELPDLPENAEQQDSDFWADVLRRVEDETRAKEADMYGAGKRSRGKQISYTGQDIDQDPSQPTKVDQNQEEARVENDADSQESDFELDGSDMSDAPMKNDLSLDLEQLRPTSSKRRKGIPSRLVLSPDGKNDAFDNGTSKENGATVEPDGRKQKRQPKKAKYLPLATADTPAPTSNGSGPSDSTAVATAKLSLAKSQITRLRYAAADCNVPYYPGKVTMILSPQLNPGARWDMYTSLASEVDEAFKQRGLEPVFMKSEVMHTLMPLFNESQSGAAPPMPVRNGASPAYKKIMPSGSSKAAAPSTGKSKQPQSQRSGKVATSSRGTPGPRSDVSWKLDTLGSGAQRGSAVQASHKPTAGAKKRASQAVKGGSAPVGGCFFCSAAHDTTSCPGLKSEAKIQEFSTKVRTSEGTVSDKAQWIKWLDDKRKSLQASSTLAAPSRSTPTSTRPRPVPKRRSTSSEQKVTDEQSAVEQLVGELIVIEDSE